MHMCGFVLLIIKDKKGKIPSPLSQAAPPPLLWMVHGGVIIYEAWVRFGTQVRVQVQV